MYGYFQMAMDILKMAEKYSTMKKLQIHQIFLIKPLSCMLRKEKHESLHLVSQFRQIKAKGIFVV